MKKSHKHYNKYKNRNKTRKQKLINMIGCSKKHNKKKVCPNCGYNFSILMRSKSKSKMQMGGTGCGSCGCPISPMSWSKMNQFGGGFYKPIGPMPGPIVGNAWTPKNWPGQNGVGGDMNYLKPYDIINDPSRQMTMNASGYKTLNSKIG